MGRKAMVAYGRLVMLGVTLVTFLFTILGLYGGDSRPADHLFTASLAFMLPVLVIANFVLIIYWILRRKLFIAIPILALILAHGYIATIFQIRTSKDSAEGAFTVATYNVHNFNNDNTGLQAQAILAVMEEQDVDILCLQEYEDMIGQEYGGVTRKMNTVYPYSVTDHDADMVILSKYEIVHHMDSTFDATSNGYMWADVVLAKGDTVRVFNVHMQTTGINGAKHQAAKGHINGRGVYQLLMGSYMMNLIERSGQSERVHMEKMKSPYPIILCGDFNDSPYSYTYNMLRGNLSDGFHEGGNGFMFTYRGAQGLFRIDYIFHDPTMRSVDYFKLDKEYSDHNPVVSRIVRKK